MGTAFGKVTDAEIYGMSSRAPVYVSVDEFQEAVHTLYENWTDGLEGCSLSDDEFGVMFTFPDRSKNMLFSYDEEDNAVIGSLRYVADSREELDSEEVEHMVEFASVLLSGEAAGLPQEVRADIKSAVATSQQQVQLRSGFKRIHGINYAYNCMASNHTNDFLMNITTYEMMRKRTEENEENVSLSLSDLIHYEGDYQYLSDTGSGRYRVEGRLENVQVSESGEITGILTDGTEKVVLRVNLFRRNSVEEFKNAEVFYIINGDDLNGGDYDAPCYLAIMCQ